jgi:hypothetical protein
VFQGKGEGGTKRVIKFYTELEACTYFPSELSLVFGVAPFLLLCNENNFFISQRGPCGGINHTKILEDPNQTPSTVHTHGYFISGDKLTTCKQVPRAFSFYILCLLLLEAGSQSVSLSTPEVTALYFVSLEVSVSNFHL